MCDYSLHAIKTRLGVEGEHLVVHRFHTGSLGLAPAPGDLESPRPQAKRNFWRMFFGLETKELSGGAVCAVCIPPGASLVLRDIPERLRRQLKVKETEQVTFTQLSACEFTYRDAMCFRNGVSVLLQHLEPGQRVEVVTLSRPEPLVEETPVATVTV